MTSPDEALRRERLAQIHARDPGADGRFWYSVVTTHVFCRPTCPSRRARPEHVRFHDTLAEARRTGFRPCRRCRPEEPSTAERNRLLIEAAHRLIERPGPPPSSRALAAAMGISPSYLHRLFRKVSGATPAAYARSLRTAPAAPGPDREESHAAPERKAWRESRRLSAEAVPERRDEIDMQASDSETAVRAPAPGGF